VTPPLLCSSERQELHAGSRPADIAGKTSLARHRWQDIAGKTSLARHRWQDFAAKTPHDQPARSPAAVEVRTLAVA
jgi:hypothetical protein